MANTLKPTKESGPVTPVGIKKPWGMEWWWAHTKKYAGKILEINKGHQLSYQYHKKKIETILVLEGKIEIVTEGQKYILTPLQSFHITKKFKHRFRALENSKVLEVSTPHLNDLVRLEDDYARK